MKRLILILAPLALAAGAASGQTADHSAHGMTPPAQDPHAGHAMNPPAPVPPAADPHAGHDMSTMASAPAQDPHAGHAMSSPAPVPPAADPHAGHDMSTMAPAPVQDPHAGHAISPPAPVQPAADPHAGHDMSTMPSTPAQDPHAGHAMPATPAGPPDIPTSADNPGRPPEAPPPAAAFSGPAHAAEVYFDAAAMAAARAGLMAEHGGMRTATVAFDRLEAGFGDGEETYLWDAQGWVGGDINRFWWKSEGEGAFGDRPEHAEVQALYSRAIRPFWDLQLGVRQDLRDGGDDPAHLVLGVQGLAPHWFEVDAAAFLSTDGDLTARVEAEYDQRITRRLILQPRVEVELSASDAPELEVGSGLGSVEAGLRLRYEVTREFAPYVGVEWSRAFAATRDFIEARGGDAEDTRLVVGLKAWF